MRRSLAAKSQVTSASPSSITTPFERPFHSWCTATWSFEFRSTVIDELPVNSCPRYEQLPSFTPYSTLRVAPSSVTRAQGSCDWKKLLSSAAACSSPAPSVKLVENSTFAAASDSAEVE